MRSVSSFTRGLSAICVVSATLFLLAACGDNNSSIFNFSSSSSQLVAVAAGTSIIMYGLDDLGDAAELGSASLPDDLAENHAIFGLVKHPTEAVIYASSLIHKDWGEARIDMFSYDASGNVTYEGQAFDYSEGSGPSCAVGVDDSCAPTTMVFSADGSRLYVDDDNDDVVQIFSVDVRIPVKVGQ